MSQHPPVKISDFQNVDVSVTLSDKAGRPVPGYDLDPGSMKATFENDKDAEFTAKISDDQKTINVAAKGELSKPDKMTVTATHDGALLTGDDGHTSATVTFEVNTTPPPQVIHLAVGQPQANKGQTASKKQAKEARETKATKAAAEAKTSTPTGKSS